MRRHRMLFDIDMYLGRLNKLCGIRGMFRRKERKRVLKRIPDVCANRETVIVDALVDYLCKKEYCLLSSGDKCIHNCKECQRNELEKVVVNYIEDI